MKRHDDILAQMGYQSKDEWLPEPVIDGRRAAMSLFNIGRGQMQIAAHHCHGGMSENRLKGKHVAAIAQVLDSKRMPKPVRVAIGDPSFAAIIAPPHHSVRSCVFVNQPA